MGKNKLYRFAQNHIFQNVFQPERETLLQGYENQGKWAEKVFKNNHPIVVELGCGKGEYTVGMARKFPNKNFIGIDIKGARIWVGAKQALEEKLENVAFIRAQIQNIEYLFAKNEISEIWITFPDPQILFRRAKNRLTHPDFLKKYTKVVKEDGIFHLKTDSEFLHGYTLGILYAFNENIIVSQHDIYGRESQNIAPWVREIKTHYEKLFSEEGKKITYIQFTLKNIAKS